MHVVRPSQLPCCEKNGILWPSPLPAVGKAGPAVRRACATSASLWLPVSLSVFGSGRGAPASDARSCVFRVGNILFSVETQTTEERTQLYHAEIDALYRDLTAKGKVLILSSEFGVGVCPSGPRRLRFSALPPPPGNCALHA